MATKFYNNIAENYDSDFNFTYSDTKDLAFEQIKANLTMPSPKILDIAAGTGNMLSFLKHFFPEANITANDISHNMLDIAKSKLGPNHTYINDDLKNITNYIQPESQDLVLAHYTMCFLESKWTIETSLKLLKKGGLLSILTTTKNNLQELHSLHFNKIAKVLNARKHLNQSCIPHDIDYLISDVIPDSHTVLCKQIYDKQVLFNKPEDIKEYFVTSGWGGSYFTDGYKYKKLLIDALCQLQKLLFSTKYPLSANNDIAIILVRKN